MKKDTLLTATLIVIRVGIVLGILMMIAGILAAVALAFGPTHWLSPQLAAPGTIGWVVAGAVIGVIALGLYVSMADRLADIIASVGDGDPFVPENTARLERMAWLSVGVQLCMIALVPVTAMLAPRIGGGDGLDLSLEGFVTALILFVLARVFRHGTMLRDDLEGTV